MKLYIHINSSVYYNLKGGKNIKNDIKLSARLIGCSSTEIFLN